MSNAQTVRGIYDAFGRGDVPRVLTHLAESVEWEYGMSNAGVPWLQPRRGRAEVSKFFEALGGLEVRQFEPKTVLESDDLVVALIDIVFVVKATGRTITEENEVHLWHFDERGQVIRFCHKLDTHQHWMAFRDR